MIAALLLCATGFLTWAAFPDPLCGGFSWSSLRWGMPFLGAFGCALRADARHLGVTARAARISALLLAGFFTVVALGMTTLEILREPPAVDYTPPGVAIPGATGRLRTHHVARCSD